MAPFSNPHEVISIPRASSTSRKQNAYNLIVHFYTKVIMGCSKSEELSWEAMCFQCADVWSRHSLYSGVLMPQLFCLILKKRIELFRHLRKNESGTEPEEFGNLILKMVMAMIVSNCGLNNLEFSISQNFYFLCSGAYKVSYLRWPHDTSWARNLL